MTKANKEGIELRIDIATTGRGVFGRKSEAYKNFCIENYKKAIENDDSRDWDVIIKDVEGKAKELGL